MLFVNTKLAAGAQRGRVGRGDHVAALEHGVVVDDDVACRRPRPEGRCPSRSGGAVDVVEEVVLDEDALGLAGSGGGSRCPSGSAPPPLWRTMLFVNVTSRTVDHGAVPSWLRDREEDAVAVLAVRPVVLEQVAVDQDALGVLQLEQVLDRPVDAGVARAAGLPRERLEQIVLADLDVGRAPGSRWPDRRRRTGRSRPRPPGSC